MVAAWLLTLPGRGGSGGALYLLTDALGADIAGPIVVSMLAAAAASRCSSRRSAPIDHVTAEDV